MFLEQFHSFTIEPFFEKITLLLVPRKYEFTQKPGFSRVFGASFIGKQTLFPHFDSLLIALILYLKKYIISQKALATLSQDGLMLDLHPTLSQHLCIKLNLSRLE